MGKGDCLDREITIAKGDGDVIVDIALGWDGTSIWPECDGPIESVRVRNIGTQTWVARLPRARGGTRDVNITPGIDQTFNGAQLATIGLETVADIEGITVFRTARKN